MSATVAAALKKIAVAILTDKKARKVVLGIILGILIILVMPLAAIIAIFNGDINIDANRLQTLVVQNMSAEEQARLQRVEDLMYEIEDKMTEAGFDKQRVKEAQVLYVLALSDFSEEAGFVDKLVGCFAEGQTDAELIAAVNAAFGTNLSVDEFTKVMSAIRAVYQLNSYDVQRRAYTDKINGEPGWTMVGIYADKGITGTSVKKRDDFNRLMRHCKQGKVDMIITKSVARFARNTLDCLKHTRMLKEHNVDVYFEEQGIHSIQPGAEFYITIYGSIAQSESENISANVRWGKAQSAKEGNVPFHYKRFLGYRRGSDGKPEIDPEQAVVVKRIYERFLAGDSLATIANDLNTDGIPTPSGVGKWQRGTIESILTNEKYKGDAIKEYFLKLITLSPECAA